MKKHTARDLPFYAGMLTFEVSCVVALCLAGRWAWAAAAWLLGAFVALGVRVWLKRSAPWVFDEKWEGRP